MKKTKYLDMKSLKTANCILTQTVISVIWWQFTHLEYILSIFMKTYAYWFFKKPDIIQLLINSISVKQRYIHTPLKDTNSHQKGQHVVSLHQTGMHNHGLKLIQTINIGILEWICVTVYKTCPKVSHSHQFSVQNPLKCTQTS